MHLWKGAKKMGWALPLPPFGQNPKEQQFFLGNLLLAAHVCISKAYCWKSPKPFRRNTVYAASTVNSFTLDISSGTSLFELFTSCLICSTFPVWSSPDDSGLRRVAPNDKAQDMILHQGGSPQTPRRSRRWQRVLVQGARPILGLYFLHALLCLTSCPEREYRHLRKRLDISAD